MSRNTSELDSAPLLYPQVASLPGLVKPATDGEATSVCSHRACRGGWRQRVPKDWPVTWETLLDGWNPTACGNP